MFALGGTVASLFSCRRTDLGPQSSIPTRPVRRGFVPHQDDHRGWRDKVGMTFRPGKAVFVLVAADRWGPVLPSKIQARMYRAFAYEGDRLGKFCLDADYAWCLNYPMLKALSPSSLQWLQCRPYISVPVVARAFTMPLVTRHPRVVRP